MTARHTTLALSLAAVITAAASDYVVASAANRAPTAVHQSGSMRSAFHTALRRTSSSGYVYVSNENQARAPFVGSVLTYPVGSNGDVSPAEDISGPNTLLTQVNGIAVDGAGEIYVVNADANSIVGFPAGSSGNVSPNVVIRGANTGLASPVALALDSVGNLYVANCSQCGYGPPGSTSVEEFAAGSSGNATPIRVIAGKRTQLGATEGIALDPKGFIYVANSFTANVTVFGPDSSGNSAPKRVLSGLDIPVGLAVAGKDLFVTAVTSGTIERFSRMAIGNASPRSKFQIDWAASPSGQSLAGITAAPDGSIYVAGYSAPLVAQYAPNAKRRAQPLSVISGPSTQLVLPTFVYVR